MASTLEVLKVHGHLKGVYCLDMDFYYYSFEFKKKQVGLICRRLVFPLVDHIIILYHHLGLARSKNSRRGHHASQPKHDVSGPAHERNPMCDVASSWGLAHVLFWRYRIHPVQAE